MDKQLILDCERCQKILNRMAFEIYERNMDESEIVLAGIHDKGYSLAQRLQQTLGSFYRANIELITIALDKFSPTQSEIKVQAPLVQMMHKSIIIVDDVLNSGRTLAYSLKPFLSIPVKKIEIAVFVDRGYALFPIAADYVGYSLTTTLKQHVEVQFSENSIEVYLQ